MTSYLNELMGGKNEEEEPSGEAPKVEDVKGGEAFGEKTKVVDSKNNEEDNLITIIKDDNIDEFTNKFSNMKQNIDEKYDYSKMSMRLINWAASFGSIKIFKFLILSKAELDDELTCGDTFAFVFTGLSSSISSAGFRTIPTISYSLL